jgi:hypothetical protein
MKPIAGTSDLELSCNPDSANPKGKEKFVEWDIHNKKLISEFRIESKDPKANYPFKNNPPSGFNTKVRLDLKDTSEDSIWDYNIYWRVNGSEPQKFDPKIPIKPRTTLIGLLFAIMAALVGFLSFQFMSKKLKGK